MRFKACGPDELEHLAGGLRDGRIALPCSGLMLSRLSLPDVVGELNQLHTHGLTEAAASELLTALAEERRAARELAPQLELVATGPDPNERARDTAVVVNQLFAEARHTVLMTGFALYDGRRIFEKLAERLDADLDFAATLCLDVSRQGTDTSRDSEIVARFARNFLEKHWPGTRRPQIYYDPRALLADRAARSVLHAKAIVVDRSKAFITSANPTPAAYQRNIELGVLVSNCTLPAQIAGHFEGLIRSGALRPLPFGSD